MSGEQVHIYSVGSPYEAELIRHMLQDHDIAAFIVNKQDSTYRFGDVEIYVHRDQVIPAKKLIGEYEAQ